MENNGSESSEDSLSDVSSSTHSVGVPGIRIGVKFFLKIPVHHDLQVYHLQTILNEEREILQYFNLFLYKWLIGLILENGNIYCPTEHIKTFYQKLHSNQSHQTNSEYFFGIFMLQSIIR